MSEPNLEALHAAHHELGHMFAFQAAQIPLSQIRVYQDGRGGVKTADGEAWTNNKRREFASTEEGRAYLAAILAGSEADRRWCDQNRLEYFESWSKSDMERFHALRRHPLTRHLSTSEIRADARRVVRANWARITRLAPKLARKRHIWAHNGRISI